MSTTSSELSLAAQAQQLAQQGGYAQAVKLLDEHGHELSADVEARYVKAVCLRKLDRHQQCIDELSQVLTLDPGFVRAHQEFGHVLLAQGKLKESVKAFEKAVGMDDALIASWRALVALYSKLKEQKKLVKAKTEILKLEELSPALQAVKSNLNRDNIDVADQICREYMLSNKQDIEGMRLLAEIANRAKIIDDAEFILESAVAFKPKHMGARFDYCNVLMKRQKFGKANEIAEQLFSDHSDNSQFKALYAATLSGVGETEKAIVLLQELVAEKFELQHAFLLLGHAQKTVGNLSEAVRQYQNLYRLRPDFGDAFWSLANTKTYQFDDTELAHMEDYRNRESTSQIDKVHFNFALGKAYEDRKDYVSAFKAYEEGNKLNKTLTSYDSPEIAKRIERQKTVCDSTLFEQHKSVGHRAPDPIFIVGLPRSGSTLLEQILASHSQVDGTLELPNILSLSRRLRGRGPSEEDEEPQYPKILAELDADYFARFGEQYIQDTQVFRQGAPFFIDKMPNNFLHIGLIKLILPNAKVIDARRHPMACCFSGFKQLFAEGQEFTYGLTEVGEYYRNYVDLMDHWDKVLPDFVLRIQHEDVVQDLETQVHKILDFCQLPFEEACLEFYKTERNVRTPSSEQVRQPIYTTGLEQWRNFEEHLGPLVEALGPDVLSRYPIK